MATVGRTFWVGKRVAEREGRIRRCESSAALKENEAMKTV